MLYFGHTNSGELAECGGDDDDDDDNDDDGDVGCDGDLMILIITARTTTIRGDCGNDDGDDGDDDDGDEWLPTNRAKPGRYQITRN